MPGAELELDVSGRSLNRPGQATDFTRGLKTELRAALKKCGELRPTTDEQLITLEFVVESTADGYEFLDVHAAEDAGMDVYVRRCLEQAFPRRITAGDGGVPAGLRYHLGFPIKYVGTGDAGAGP